MFPLREAGLALSIGRPQRAASWTAMGSFPVDWTVCIAAFPVFSDLNQRQKRILPFSTDRIEKLALDTAQGIYRFCQPARSPLVQLLTYNEILLWNWIFFT